MQRQEIAELLHISPAGVHYLAANHPDFPPPVKLVRVGGRGARLWLRDEIEAWAGPHGYFGRAAADAAPVDVEPAKEPAPAGPVYAAPAPGRRHYARRAARAGIPPGAMN